MYFCLNSTTTGPFQYYYYWPFRDDVIYIIFSDSKSVLMALTNSSTRRLLESLIKNFLFMPFTEENCLLLLGLISRRHPGK